MIGKIMRRIWSGLENGIGILLLLAIAGVSFCFGLAALSTVIGMTPCWVIFAVITILTACYVAGDKQ